MAQLSLQQLQQRKEAQKKITVLTVYDACFARIASEAGIDILFIGDSLGMVIKGDKNTLKVTTEEIAYHTRCVAAANDASVIMADLPFMSYATPEMAALESKRLMQAGAEIIKIEGGAWLADTISFLTERGIPVCAHIGLTPQFIHVLGGFRVQGREQEQAESLLEAAKTLEQAGAKLIVLECVPYPLAKKITEATRIPVIGIGAGPYCDGQVLVAYDIVGITPGKQRKFVKNYMEGGRDIKAAMEAYIYEVQNSLFPTIEHSFE